MRALAITDPASAEGFYALAIHVAVRNPGQPDQAEFVHQLRLVYSTPDGRKTEIRPSEDLQPMLEELRRDAPPGDTPLMISERALKEFHGRLDFTSW